MRKKLLRGRAFGVILMSYLAAVFVPLLFGVATSVSFSRALGAQLETLGGFSAAQIKLNAEKVLSEAELLTKTLSGNSDIRNIVQAPEEKLLTPDMRMEMTHISAKLSGGESEYVSSVYLYFRENHSLLTKGLRATDKMLDYVLAERLCFSEQELWDQVKSSGDMKLVARVDEKDNIILMIIYPVLAPTHYSYSGALIITLDMTRFRELLASSAPEGGKAYLMLDGGLYISSNGGGVLPGGDAFDSMSMFKGESVSVSYSTSYGTSYISSIPARKYYMPVRRVLGITAVYVAVCTATGVTYSVMAAKRRYKIVERLYSITPANTTDEAFGAIEQALNSAVQQKRRLRSYEAREGERLRERLLARILTSGELPSIERLKEYDIELPYDRFIVAAFDVYNEENLFFGKESLEEDDLRELCFVIIRSVVEEFITTVGRGYVTRIKDALYCIINCKTGENVTQPLNDAVTFIKTNFGVELWYALSDLVISPTGLPEACRFANERLERMDENDSRRVGKESPAEKARRYIDENFRDPMMDITRVADACMMSPSYIAHVFRRDIGVTIYEYISFRRLMLAKKLLCNPERLLLSDIATEVGYSNTRALIRAMKRSEGCTPSEWRKRTVY